MGARHIPQPFLLCGGRPLESTMRALSHSCSFFFRLSKALCLRLERTSAHALQLCTRPRKSNCLATARGQYRGLGEAYQMSSLTVIRFAIFVCLSSPTGVRHHSKDAALPLHIARVVGVLLRACLCCVPQTLIAIRQIFLTMPTTDCILRV